MPDCMHIYFQHEIADVIFNIDCLVARKPGGELFADETLITHCNHYFCFDGCYVADGPTKTVPILEQIEKIAIEKYLKHKEEN